MCTLKDIDNKVARKARLVAKGFEDLKLFNLLERNIEIIDSVNCTKELGTVSNQYQNSFSSR